MIQDLHYISRCAPKGVVSWDVQGGNWYGDPGSCALEFVMDNKCVLNLLDVTDNILLVTVILYYLLYIVTLDYARRQ